MLGILMIRKGLTASLHGLHTILSNVLELPKMYILEAFRVCKAYIHMLFVKAGLSSATCGLVTICHKSVLNNKRELKENLKNAKNRAFWG